MTTRRPDRADIETAADWLEVNEGEDGESEACSRVATWLREYGRTSDERAMAREAGCSVKYLRIILKEDEKRRDAR